MMCSETQPAGAREPRLGLTLLVGLVVLVAAAKPILFDTLDPDCFWHLQVARQLRSDGIGPLIDRFSFASINRPWTPYSWLAELGMDSLWRLGGWRAAVGAQAIMQAAFVMFIAMACRARPARKVSQWQDDDHATFTTDSTVPGALETAVATAAAAFLSLAYLSFRPVTAGLAILAMIGWLIARDRRGGERTTAVWLLVPMTALLINLHLYAVLVPLWIASLWLGAVLERRQARPHQRPEAERRVTRYGWLLVATALACMATPMLPGVIATALHYQSGDPMVASGVISEMQPFYHGGAGKISAVVVLIMAGFTLLGRRQLRAGEWLALALATAFLLRLGRFAPVFAIVATPMFARSLPKFTSRILMKPAVCALMAIVLSIGIVRLCMEFPRPSTTLETWLNRHGPDTPGYPCDATNFVASHVQPATGRLINEFTWGGYLEWRLGDHYQTLLDGRTQLFSPAFWHATYLDSEDRRAAFLSQINADAAVLPVHRSMFQDTLVKQGWTVAYQDDRAQVLLPPAGMVKDAAPKFPFATIFFGE